MIFRFFIIFALWFEAIHAGSIQKTADDKNKVSFSVEKIWQGYTIHDKWDTCPIVKPKTREMVQKTYDGCRIATWKFCGLSYNIADVVMKSFEDYLVKLMYFSNSNSTVLTSSSAAIMDAVAKCNKLGKSSLIIIKEYNLVLTDLVRDFNNVVTKIENILGSKVSDSFNNAVVDLRDTFSNVMTEVLQCTKDGAIEVKQIKYEPVYKKCQVLMNTVALIAETVLNECQLSTREVHEAVTTLTLIFYHFALTVQGINSCIQDYLLTNNQSIRQHQKACSESFEYVLVEVTQSVKAVVFPFTKSIKELLTILVNVAKAFNTAAKDALGVFEGVSITKEDIIQDLTRDESRNS